MSETHLQVKKDGSIESLKTALWPSKRDEQESVLRTIFSQSGWTVTEITNVRSCRWQIKVKSAVKAYKINLYISSIRDEDRQPDEFKTQIGTTEIPVEIPDWVTLILGIYKVAESDDTYILAGTDGMGINFASNPSLRIARTPYLQKAQIFGWCQTPNSIVFRPDFVYHYVQWVLDKQSDGSSTEISYKTKSDIDEPLQIIYYGAPGTGKSHSINKKADPKLTNRTTFHPDTDYASFVGAYKPTMENVPMSYVSDGFAKYAKNTDKHPGKERRIVYKYVAQAFLKAYVAAWKNLDTPRFLVIEEINRGNCAQIFGDLFQLLDRNEQGCSTYPIDADDDIRQFIAEDPNGFGELTDEQAEAIRSFVLLNDESNESLPIGEEILSGEKLLLPPNLYIWATMNTSDQSLFPIDSAFKRRWNWRYQPINTRAKDWTFQVGDKKYVWGDFLELINPIIQKETESADKQMGFFFARPEKGTTTISQDVFLNKVLFYLWTDVFKDYPVRDAKFIDKATNKIYVFADFFSKPETLEAFVSGLGMTPVETEEEPETADETDTEVTPEGLHLQMKINGDGPFWKKAVFAELVKRYAAAHPDLSAADVVAKFKTLGMIIPRMIETQAEYDANGEYIHGQAIDINGENVYVSTRVRPRYWGESHLRELKKKLDENPDFGFKLEEAFAK